MALGIPSHYVHRSKLSAVGCLSSEGLETARRRAETCTGARGRCQYREAVLSLWPRSADIVAR